MVFYYKAKFIEDILGVIGNTYARVQLAFLPVYKMKMNR
jgi:hypothetical protein